MRWLLAGSHSLDSILRVSTYYLAQYLARDADASVFYLSAPISPLHFLRPNDRFRERRSYWGREARRAGNRFEYAPCSLLPVIKTSLLDRTGILRNSLRATVPSLRNILDRAGFLRPDALIITNLQYAYLDRIVRPRCLVYRCIDDIHGFRHAPHALRQAEVDLLKRCDLVFTIAQDQTDKMRARGWNGPAPILDTGVDYERLANADASDAPKDVLAIPHPRIVFVGSINERFDNEWVIDAARARPDYQFLIVGPGDVSTLREAALPNLHLLGPRHPDTIPALLAACDVGMIPFRPSPLVASTNPIKLFEYAAAGLPTVSTRWGELERLHPPAELVTDGREFLDAIDRAVRSDPCERQHRQEWAASRSWDKTFRILEDGVREFLEKRPSP
jgi:glycosyltransferase involved in cell wall biosynthesis